MNTISTVRLLNASLLALFLLNQSACGRKDIDKAADAQTCLDSSTQATVSQCVDMVAGMETAQSYVIRCAAGFIAEWTDLPTKLSNASASMNTNGTGGSGANASLTVLGVLAFSSTTSAATNLTNCNKSGSKGLILLSGIANMATNLKTLSGSCTTIGTTCLTAAAGNSTVADAVGAAAIVAYNANCTGGQTNNSQFCNQFTAAGAGGTASNATIGSALLNNYLSACNASPGSCPN